MRTTNGVERLHKEIKRRTRVASFFPNGFQGQVFAPIEY
jgi:transposase-like protein